MNFIVHTRIFYVIPKYTYVIMLMRETCHDSRKGTTHIHQNQTKKYCRTVQYYV